ncbi:MAG: phosphatidate cytidylyltransferase [Bacteroidetes bacterium]|nr:phosphatidate cytidylyltransferase [Bacteroidota bacterium]
MAFSVASFKTRTLTAVFFVGVMAGGLFLHPASYLLLFLFLLIASWHEYAKLIHSIVQLPVHPYLLLGWILNGLAICLLLTNALSSIGNFGIADNLVLPLQLAGFILLILGTFSIRSGSMKQWWWLAAGNLYLTLPFALVLHLYGYGPLPARELVFNSSVWWVVVAIATMWINDTLAYLMGSLIGRTPFSSISPKKTWEGTLSGIFGATLLLGWVLDRFMDDAVFSAGAGYGLIFLLTIAGTLGDLFESKLKRKAGVKDSGRLMPGHGGVLDRFDSLLFALPVVYLFLRVLSLWH